MDPQIQVLVMIHDKKLGKVTVTSGLKEFPREMTIQRAAEFALANALEKLGITASPARHD